MLKDSGLLNGISILIIVGFWLLIICIFINEVLFKLKINEEISRYVQAFFTAIIYIFAQSLFLRITVVGITEADVFNDAFWSCVPNEIAGRYQIAISIAVFALLVVIVKFLQQNKMSNIQIKTMVIILLCAMISQPRLQLKGIGNDDYVGTRYVNWLYEYNLYKSWEYATCRMVPIGGTWTYRKNVSLYCLGDNTYNWSATNTDFEMEEIRTDSVTLGDYPINTDIEIWQVFITKLNLIERSNYKIVLLDSAGNIIHQQYQDNTNYQKLTSFTFDTGISGVNQIIILDGEGNSVYIENSMYIVAEEGQRYFKE